MTMFGPFKCLVAALCASHVAGFVIVDRSASSANKLSMLPPVESFEAAANLLANLPVAIPVESVNTAADTFSAVSGPGVDPTYIAGAAIFAGAAGLGVATTNKGADGAAAEVAPEPEPEPIDVSIPYDATALLAYKAMRPTEDEIDEALFAQFKTAYYEKAVAEVTLKQKMKKLDALMA